MLILSFLSKVFFPWKKHFCKKCNWNVGLKTWQLPVAPALVREYS